MGLKRLDGGLTFCHFWQPMEGRQAGNKAGSKMTRQRIMTPQQELRPFGDCDMIDENKGTR